MSTHRLSGGQRVVDVMGPESASIAFTGAFSGIDAVQRAKRVDFLRIAGTVVPLSWDSLYFNVIVAKFQAAYQNRIWIPFQVTCTVVRDDATDSRSAVVAQDDGLAASMLATAAALLMTVPATSQYIVNLGLPDDGLANQTAAATNASNLALAQDSVGRSLAASEAQFLQAASFQDQPPATAMSALGTAESAGQNMSALVLARSYLSVAGLSSGTAS
ncbi:MAG: hypothetical protein P4L71_08495 [Acetobacteraceae bacterium]|nr:hypothetical protein [Acetobacteraceae bacterium]